MAIASELTIIANPGHGNGPTVALLMAAEAIQAESDRPVNLIVPDLGDDRQGAVVTHRRRRDRPLRIFFDPWLGGLVRWITLRDNSFHQNVRDIVEYQPHVQRLVDLYLRRGLRDLTELSGDGAMTRSARRFSRTDLTVELNHGSRLRFLDTERAFYFFPCLLSDLLRRREFTGALAPGLVDMALAHAEDLERGYARLFLPYVHTFSWDASWRPPHANVEFMPLPRPVTGGDSSARPPRPGLYLMPSGVGDAGDRSIIGVARSILAADPELAIYYPDPTPAAYADAFPEGLVLSPRSIPDDRIRVVIGRAGWGTLWECLNATKVFVAIPAIAGDDPEIASNLKTLEARGLAICWPPGRPSSLWQDAAQVKETVRRLLAGFDEVDGLRWLARRILPELRG